MARRTRKIKRSRSKRRVRRLTRKSRSRRRLTRKSGGGLTVLEERAAAIRRYEKDRKAGGANALKNMKMGAATVKSDLLRSAGKTVQIPMLKKSIKQLGLKDDKEELIVFDTIKGDCLLEWGPDGRRPKSAFGFGFTPEKQCRERDDILDVFINTKIPPWTSTSTKPLGQILALQKKLREERDKRGPESTDGVEVIDLVNPRPESTDGVEVIDLLEAHD